MTDEEAYDAFVAIRFAERDGEPFCVWCGCAALYRITTRRKWKCQSCLRQFSVTSRTIFASRKLPIRDILCAIILFANGAKGMSALQLGRDLGVQYKTAFVLAHKLREALGSLQAAQQLRGEVEIDGAYFGVTSSRRRGGYTSVTGGGCRIRAASGSAWSSCESEAARRGPLCVRRRKVRYAPPM